MVSTKGFSLGLELSTSLGGELGFSVGIDDGLVEGIAIAFLLFFFLFFFFFFFFFLFFRFPFLESILSRLAALSSSVVTINVSLLRLKLCKIFRSKVRHFSNYVAQQMFEMLLTLHPQDNQSGNHYRYHHLPYQDINYHSQMATCRLRRNRLHPLQSQTPNSKLSGNLQLRPQ